MAERSAVEGGHMKKPLPHSASHELPIQKARALRQNMTEEEVMLWLELRRYRKFGYSFLRQAPIGKYIVDFLCRKLMLIIEVDGEHHASGIQKEHDIARDALLQKSGYCIKRYWNADIHSELDSVIDDIELSIKSILKLSPSEPLLPLAKASHLPLAGEEIHGAYS